MAAQVFCDLCGGKLVMQGAGNIVCDGCGMTYSMEYLKEKLAGAAQKSAPAAAPAAAPAPAPAPAQDFRAVIGLAWQDIRSERYDAARAKADQVLSAVYDHAEAWSVRVSATLRKDGLTAAAGELKAALKAVAADKHAEVTEPIKEHMAAAKDFSGRDVAAVAAVSPELAQVAADQVAAAAKKELTGWFNYSREFFVREEASRPDDDHFYSSVYADCYKYFLSTLNIIDHSTNLKLLPLVKAIGDHHLRVPQDLMESAEEINRYLTDATGFRIWTKEQNRKGDFVRAFLPVIPEKGLQDNVKSLREKLKNLQWELENVRLAYVADYWYDHPEEKAALEKEAAELQAQLSAAEKERSTNPSVVKMAEIDKTIEALNREKSSLGLFKKARKNEIEAQLDSLYDQRHEIKKSSEAALRTLEHKIDDLTNKLEAVEEKLDNP